MRAGAGMRGCDHHQPPPLGAHTIRTCKQHGLRSWELSQSGRITLMSTTGMVVTDAAVVAAY